MKLSEIKVGQTVWHPIFGKGEVSEMINRSSMSGTIISFKDSIVIRIVFYEPSDAVKGYFSRPDLTSHLYPYPVKVIATDEHDSMKSAIGDLMAENKKLSELVKAQEEYMRYYEQLFDRPESYYLDDLRTKINQLQSKTDK